jgi:hypothetical protein
VAHALGCNRLSGLVQSRHDETAEVLREFVGRLGFSSSRKERYSRGAPRTPKRPQARWNFHYNLCHRTGHVLDDVSFIQSLDSFYFRSAARTTGHAAALRDADKRWDYFADHSCPGYALRAIPFQTLGRFSLHAMQFLCEATHAAFLQPACRLLRQCVPAAVRGAVLLPISHANRCSGPPHRTHGLRLNPSTPQPSPEIPH